MNEITISRKPESVPLLTIGDHSPYPVGDCPRAGWYAIEACGYSDLEASPLVLAHGGQAEPDEAYVHLERLRPVDLVALVEHFDPAVNGGNGLLINDCHLHHVANQTDKAKGFVRALATVNGVLYGYLELTEQGHREVNGGEFWATSTEYPYADYEKTDELGNKIFWAPRRLAGLALTNNPEHSGQPGLCRYHKKEITMKKTRTLAALHSQAPAVEDEQKLNSESAPEEQKLNTSQADEEAKLNTQDENLALNTDEPADGWAAFADECAAIFGFDDAMSGEEMLEKLREFKADFDALASAGPAPAEPKATHCRPRFKAASQTRLHSAATPKLNVRVSRAERCATHCQKAVASAAAAKGGRLDEKSFRAVWSRAEDEFNQQN